MKNKPLLIIYLLILTVIMSCGGAEAVVVLSAFLVQMSFTTAATQAAGAVATRPAAV